MQTISKYYPSFFVDLFSTNITGHVIKFALLSGYVYDHTHKDFSDISQFEISDNSYIPGGESVEVSPISLVEGIEIGVLITSWQGLNLIGDNSAVLYNTQTGKNYLFIGPDSTDIEDGVSIYNISFPSITLTAPAPPSVVTVIPYDNSVFLEWQQNSTELGLSLNSTSIEIIDSNQNVVKSSTLQKGNQNIILDEIESTATYFLRVKSNITNALSSPWSPGDIGYQFNTLFPNPPASLSATVLSPSSVEVYWIESTSQFNIDSYIVEIFDNNQVKVYEIETQHQDPLLINGLNPSGLYFVRISTKDTNGGISSLTPSIMFKMYPSEKISLDFESKVSFNPGSFGVIG